MRVIIFLISAACLLPGSTPSKSNAQEETPVFSQVERCLCRIYLEHELDGRRVTERGCGVVFRHRIQDSHCYFVCTAYHVIENMLLMNNVTCRIFLQDCRVADSNSPKYWPDRIRRDHIVWRNREMDAAIIALPAILSHDPFPEGYKFPGLAYVKQIADASMGQEVFMMGPRWYTDKVSGLILKRGIISGITKELPRYKGHPIFLVDQMSNKGMSGGLLFSNDGRGIGMISSYVLESDQGLRTSDDLTVCVPLSILLDELQSVISEKGDKVLSLIRGEQESNSEGQ